MLAVLPYYHQDMRPSANRPNIEQQHSVKGGDILLKSTLRYMRYAFTTLATVGFTLSLN